MTRSLGTALLDHLRDPVACDLDAFGALRLSTALALLDRLTPPAKDLALCIVGACSTKRAVGLLRCSSHESSRRRPSGRGTAPGPVVPFGGRFMRRGTR